ncbi:hypothetical protein GCM10025771_05630 [Niveibacterium umoris]|uniref:TRAP transporter small permease protein n=1 Tax=Niveibacterium umoris TaxID=1193620 RepID=A0A840BR00_9RHOO|nr:TRAP transporter small permease subunit [Niveibacterium umoris]MBB4013889.1 TRAP-type C4-dicarboxylate transport system permease small subunit [Niveibacterium umoris]
MRLPAQAAMRAMRPALDVLLSRALMLGGVLVIPVSLLLCLQWPLRDWLHHWSREANDLAQWLFALYVAMAITAATRARSHLASHLLAHRYRSRTRHALERAAAALVLLPFSLFLIWAGAPAAWQSVLQREGFPDTYNPGYFMIRVAGLLLAVLVALQALLDLLPADDA